MAGNILVGGFGDGGLKVYDRRISPRDSMVSSYDGFHHSWIVNVQMQRGGNRDLVSGSLDGEFRLWDLRLKVPVRVRQVRGSLSHLAVHEHAPIFASTTSNDIEVWDMDGEPDSDPIPNISDRPAGEKTLQRASMNALAFHPHHMIVGCSVGTQIDFFEIVNYKSRLDKVQASISPLGNADRIATRNGTY